MRATEVKEKQVNSMDRWMRQAVKADANLEGIKTVCADIVQISDDEVLIQFISTDGTQIKPIKQSQMWAGRTLNKLKGIWGLDINASFEDLQQACCDETRDVMFFERSGTNENGAWDMQDFRKPNAIDRGRVNHEKIVKHTHEIVQRDIEYRKQADEIIAQKESEEC